MRTKFLPAFIFGCICATAPIASGQIAITEFLNNPDGEDTLREFFELFNYTQAPVDIAGWTVSDEDSDSIVLTTGSRIIAPGGYLVFSVNKAQMEADYFGGVSQADIIEYDGSDSGFVMANSSDEIILSDGEGEVVWSLAYMNDDNSGHATFLAEDDFSITVWGSKEFFGIERDGVDPASDTIGYESNQATDDPAAGPETENEDIASPLAGFYTTVGGGGTTPDFRILSIVPGTVAGTFDITFESEIAGFYSVESSSDLADFTFESIVPTSDSTTQVTVIPSAGFDQIFYRIRRSDAIEVE